MHAEKPSMVRYEFEWDEPYRKYVIIHKFIITTIRNVCIIQGEMFELRLNCVQTQIHGKRNGLAVRNSDALNFQFIITNVILLIKSAKDFRQNHHSQTVRHWLVIPISFCFFSVFLLCAVVSPTDLHTSPFTRPFVPIKFIQIIYFNVQYACMHIL